MNLEVVSKLQRPSLVKGYVRRASSFLYPHLLTNAPKMFPLPFINHFLFTYPALIFFRVCIFHSNMGFVSPPTPIQLPFASPGCYLCIWPTGFIIEVPMASFWVFTNLPEWLTGIRETFYLLGHRCIITGYNSGTARWKRCIGQGVGKGMELPCLLGACHSPHTSTCLPTPAALQTHPLWLLGFIIIDMID